MLWLSDKESDVYLKCRELGSSPVAPIARHLWWNRVTVYSLLQSLLKKWIASCVSRSDVTYYTVISPQTLYQQLSFKAKEFWDVVPELMTLWSHYGNKPKVEYYEGFSWLQSVYQHVLDHAVWSVRMFMGVRNIDPSFKTYIDTVFVPERVKRGIFSRVIAPKSVAMDEYHLHDESVLREMMLIDDQAFDFTNEIIVYGESYVAMAMFQSDDMSWTIISSAAIHQSLKSIFDILYHSR